MEEGEYLAIMGPSGSGKSTLMNIIGCLDKPTKGDFKLDGLDILNLGSNALADVRLKNSLRLSELPAASPADRCGECSPSPDLCRGGKKSNWETAAAALDKVGASDRINFVPNQLSGGQQQRVTIARAMVNQPKILLADEPTGALDSKSSAQVMDLFTTLNQEGVTVIMITHDSHVAGFAKRRVDIFDGEISEYKPQEVTL